MKQELRDYVKNLLIFHINEPNRKLASMPDVDISFDRDFGLTEPLCILNEAIKGISNNSYCLRYEVNRNYLTDIIEMKGYLSSKNHSLPLFNLEMSVSSFSGYIDFDTDENDVDYRVQVDDFKRALIYTIIYNICNDPRGIIKDKFDKISTIS